MLKKPPTLAISLLGILLVSITTIIVLPFIRITPTYAKNFTSLNYVAFGDSITAASFDSGGGYVTRYKNHLITDLGVNVTATNKGVGGSTSAELLNSLKSDLAFRTAVTIGNQASVMIGLNDLIQAASRYLNGSCGGSDNQDCLRNLVIDFQGNLTKIVNEIKLLNQSPSFNIILSEIYYPSTGNLSSDPNFPIFNPYLTQMNGAVNSLGQALGLGVAKVHTGFNGVSGTEDPFLKGYLLSDGLHPSPTGHDVIAAEFRKLNSFILAKDTDADGFINSTEKYLGTDLLAGCPTSTSHKAYPPDLNNSGRVDVADILAVSQQGYGKDTSSPDWDTKYKRMDFDMNGKITVNDVLKVVNLYYTGFC